MAFDTIQLGGFADENIKKINDNFSNVLSKDNTVAFTPDADYEPATKKYVDEQSTFEGSSPIVVSGKTISHAASGATANSYGDTSAQTPAYGATFKVPAVTVNSTGHVTAISEHTVKIPASDNTDTKVTNLNKTDGKVVTGASTSGQVTTLLSDYLAELKLSNFVLSDDSGALTATDTLKVALSKLANNIEALSSGMKFKGTVGSGGDFADLPTSGVKVGDTYKVYVSGTYAGVAADSGDMFIATATTPVWSYVPSGDDAETPLSLGADTTGSGTSFVTGLTVNGHKITMAKASETKLSKGSDSSSAITPGTTEIITGVTVSDHTVTLTKGVLPAYSSDTKSERLAFDATTNWSASATDGKYTLTLNVGNNAYPTSVFKLVSGTKYGKVDAGIYIDGNIVSITSYAKFAGYVILAHC